MRSILHRPFVAGRRRGRALLIGALAAAVWLELPAQGPPQSPVRYTEAREREVRRTIQLSGSVEARTSSLVGSEVAGLVEALQVREGDTVRKGQTLARLRTATLEVRLQAAQAQLKEAASRRKLAQMNMERTRGLYDSNVVSRQDLDNAESELEAWEGRVETLEAEIARLRIDIDRSAIRAPFAGTVVSERTEIGEWVQVGGPVVELISLQDLEIRVEVPERHFSSLNPGAEATVTFDSVPGLKAPGRVSAVVPRADARARTFPIKIRIANQEGRVGPGMLAQVSFPAGESYRATVVPKDALVTQGEAQFVYVIGAGNTVAQVPVHAGEGFGSWVVVEGKIAAGQKVVTRGNERLSPGAIVAGEPIEYALP